MTDEEYKRLITAARKAAADEDYARWMARLKGFGAVEPQGTPPKSKKAKNRRSLELDD